MKRIFFVILALVLCLQPLSVLAAEGAVTVTVSNAEFCAGSTARLEVSISGNPGYSHMTAEISYDNSCLILTKIEKVNAPSLFTANVEKNRVAAAGFENIQSDGVMFVLYFDVLQQGEHEVTVHLESIGDADGKLFSPTVVPGLIRAQVHEYQLYTSEPTCTEDGIVGKKCAICGEVEETERIPALGHSFEQESDAVCKVCGKNTEKPEETVPMTNPGQNGRPDAPVATQPNHTWMIALVIVLAVLVLLLAGLVIVLLRRPKRMEDDIPLPTFEDVDDIE